jgi:hypothetical protein
MIDDPYLAKTTLSFTSIYAGIETKVKKHVNMYFYKYEDVLECDNSCFFKCFFARKLFLILALQNDLKIFKN